MAAGHNIPEYQGCRTGPTHIVQDRIGGSSFYRQLRCAGNGNVLTESNRDQ